MPRRERYRGSFTADRAYDEGYDDGYDDAMDESYSRRMTVQRRKTRAKPKAKPRKLNAWQKYVKQPKNKILYKSGKDKGKLNFKAMGRAFRKKNK